MTLHVFVAMPFGIKEGIDKIVGSRGERKLPASAVGEDSKDTNYLRFICQYIVCVIL